MPTIAVSIRKACTQTATVNLSLGAVFDISPSKITHLLSEEIFKECLPSTLQCARNKKKQGTCPGANTLGKRHHFQANYTNKITFPIGLSQ